jgi:hypothetical protein
MEREIIGVKQLHRDFKMITQRSLRGESFLVVKNSKPIFTINPIGESKRKKYSLSDAKKIQFMARDKDLSKRIDKEIY